MDSVSLSLPLKHTGTQNTREQVFSKTFAENTMGLENEGKKTFDLLALSLSDRIFLSPSEVRDS